MSPKSPPTTEIQGLQDLVSDLRGRISELTDIMIECAGSEPGVEDYDWIDVSEDFFTAYYTALQMMEQHKYVGADRFRSLFSDDTFSMGAYMAHVGWSCAPSPEKSSIMHDRLWEMYFLLNAMPSAVAACRGELISHGAEDAVAALHRYRDELAVHGPVDTRARIRTALENAVNIACVVRATVWGAPGLMDNCSSGSSIKPEVTFGNREEAAEDLYS